MTDIATTILELGKGLDPDERTIVAHKLLATLHDNHDTAARRSAEATWNAELRRRIDDIETGRVEPVSHTDTVEIAREIARRRT